MLNLKICLIQSLERAGSQTSEALLLASANLPFATIRNTDLIIRGCLGVPQVQCHEKDLLENAGLYLCEHLIKTTNVSFSNLAYHSPTLADLLPPFSQPYIG